MFWSIAPLVIGLHRAGGHGRDVLVSARRNQPRAGAVLRRGRRPCGPTRRRWASRSGCRSCPRAGRPTPAAAAASRTAGPTRRPVSALHAVTSTVGYISPTGMYLSLTQSNADEDKLVGSIHPSMYPDRSRRRRRHPLGGLSGRRRRDAEPVWTTRLNGPGGAGANRDNRRRQRRQFRTLASATQSQPPLPTASHPRKQRDPVT